MRNSINYLCFIFIIAMHIFLTGCKEEPPEEIPVTAIKLDMAGLSLHVGGTKTINAAVEPAEAVNKRITWSSSDQSVAYIDQYGLITAFKKGTAVITASSPFYDDVVSACIVAVTEPSRPNLDDPNEPFMHMVKIEGGKFQMGSPETEEARRDDENMRKNSEVTLDSFWIGKYQVTQKQYQTVMGNNPSVFKGRYLPKEVTTGDYLPVESVSWYAAIVFCNRLSIREDLTPVYYIQEYQSSNPGDWGTIPISNNNIWESVEIIPDANGYRLPTEAEWEYACRAGTTTKYWTGDNDLSITGNGNVADLTCLEIPTYAGSNLFGKWIVMNFYDGYSEIAPVGSFAPNPWGLYDILGNVYEWCWDWYTESYNNAGGNVNPQGPKRGEARVFRGGSWGRYGEYLRSAYRVADYPYRGGDLIGFRVARNN
ncbi:MAG: SUMF1/EgtB/PvdO family nonheme iron enzyme [Treponema sp.]|nr:SUMF1/EgtB/PvdO family nonheme iron enzyme [Treponema sp.]